MNTANYKGRFAPSATGDLHMGSLVTALACALEAYQRQGSWIIRIDDIDHHRCTQNSSHSISKTLEYCFHDLPFSTLYKQSQSLDLYHLELKKLIAQQKVYACHCSRKQLVKVIETGHHQCRYNTISRFEIINDASLRFKSSCYDSLILQLQQDLILFRRDHCFSYHYSCVVNDQIDQITHLIRGADLIYAQQIQSQLIKALGYRQIHYHYIPLVCNQNGQKLSKQNKARPLNVKLSSVQLLRDAIRHLRWSRSALSCIPKNENPLDLVQWAVDHWNLEANSVRSHFVSHSLNLSPLLD